MTLFYGNSYLNKLVYKRSFLIWEISQVLLSISILTNSIQIII